MPSHHVAFWGTLTHVGAAGLVALLFGVTVAGLWMAAERTAARIWTVGLTLGAGLTLLTKILFLGWGIGSASLDFTGISGHAFLSAAVVPVLFGWLSGRQNRTIGIAVGMALSLGVAISRLVLQAHSMSEVVLGWMLGTLVSAIALSAIRLNGTAPLFARLAPCLLLLGFGNMSSGYLDTHRWETRLALYLSGRDHPYTRRMLLEQCPAPAARRGAPTYL